jgi:basic membrane protein A and related proteins
MNTPTPGASLRLLLAMLVAAALTPGCKKKKPRPVEGDEQTSAQPKGEEAGRSYVVGFVYSGPKMDGGFNQAHAKAAAAVAKLFSVRVVEDENVSEDSSAMLTFEKQVAVQNASTVFATAPTHFDPPVLTLALKYPKVFFRHFGGHYEEGKHPVNVASSHGYLDEALYVSGVVAGMTTKTRKLGFVAGKNLPHVARSVNAFTLGARSVNAAITTTVVFTGSWSNAEAEAKAANALVDQKVDVLAMYVNSPRVVLETAERRGIYSVGVHVNGIEYAPKGYLTGAEWDLVPMYTAAVTALRDGKPAPRIVRGGLAEGYVTISPFGPAVPDKVRQKALAVREMLMRGKLAILKGPLKDNVGRVVIPAGTAMTQNDIRLETNSYLVGGVGVIKAPL